jgi:hypothetical protein
MGVETQVKVHFCREIFIIKEIKALHQAAIFLIFIKLLKLISKKKDNLPQLAI